MGAHTQTRCCSGNCSQGRECPARQAWVDIDGPHKRPRAKALAVLAGLLQAALTLACVAAFCATLGFAAGYIHWGGLLP